METIKLRKDETNCYYSCMKQVMRKTYFYEVYKKQLSPSMIDQIWEKTMQHHPMHL